MEMTDKLVQRAYHLYLEQKNDERDSLALKTINDFHRKIARWDESIPGFKRLGFFQHYLVGPHMEAIASSGSAAAKHDNFKSLMIKPSTLAKIRSLFVLRKAGPVEENMISQLAEIDLINHVTEHPNRTGNRPSAYINRFLICMFIEIMTTIADKGQLSKTARLLGKNPDNVSFERLQVQVRESVDEALDRLGIGQELNLFTRATIAYFIEAAGKEMAG
ncbi:hypothetical protein [Pseudoneobacillus sp. C159]